MSGFVNFPVDSTDYKSTNEGGMFVTLIAMDKKGGYWAECCGAESTFMDSVEVLVSDDKIGRPSYNPNKILEWVSKMTLPKFIDKLVWKLVRLELENHDRKNKIYDEVFFPRINNPILSEKSWGSRDYDSVPLLCSMTIGTTGWSGSNEEKGYWHCTYEDLTEEGKKLYDLIQKLYSNCEVYLLTWLDT